MSEFGANLLSDIAQEFNKRIKRDKKLKQIANRVRDGTADYAQAGEYAVRVGELLAESLQGNTKNLAFISKEVAAEILGPMLQYDHELITEVTNAVQANMNAAAGVGIAVQTPEIDTNRIDGLINKVASYSTAQESQWALKEPVVNYSQAIVDQSIRDNAKAAHKVGLETYIVREAEPGACKWCRALEGTYEYKGNGSNIPRDVYRRHAFCRCILTYANGKQRQNVWDHRETWTEEDAKAQVETVKAAENHMNGDYYPETVANAPRGKPMTWDEADSGNVNPNYEKGRGYQTNCQSCVVTMEARLRGYDVEVLPRTKGSMLETLAYDTAKAWKNPDGTPAKFLIGDIEEFVQMDMDGQYLNAKKYEKKLLETLEPGARYNLRFDWKGKTFGHIVSLDISDDGILHVYDPQVNHNYYGNEVSEYLKLMKYTTRSYAQKYNSFPQVMRVDDKIFNLDVVNKIMNVKR